MQNRWTRASDRAWLILFAGIGILVIGFGGYLISRTGGGNELMWVAITVVGLVITIFGNIRRGRARASR